MSIVVTVNIPNADLAKSKQVAEDNPELYQQLFAIFGKNGFVSHRRLVRGNDILDIDEWESEEGYKAAIAEAQPIIDEINRLRGSDAPVDTVWQVA